MPNYDYVALDTGGRERRGSVRADTPNEGRAKLEARKLYVVRIEQGSETAPAPSLLSRAGAPALKRRLSAKQLTLFTRQVATLAQVAPLEEALRTIARQAEQPHVRRVLENVHAGVVEGRRLSDSMAREPRSFPPLYRAMVAAGESSGSLPTILDRLSDLLERQAAVRAKVMTALAYPTILALVAVGVVFALMVFVVPQVVAQFDSVGQDLPLLTRIVIGISNFLRNWWWALAILIAGLGVLGWRGLREPHIRMAVDRSILRIPLIGRLVRDLHAARMARTLSTMVSSRLPLLEGLTLTTGTIHNRALRAASADIVEAIRGGGSLSVALRRAGVFPPLLVYMTASGEAAGKLDIMLERAADYLEREFDAFTSAALSLLEPAIIVLMGGIVAIIVLSILLPILQLDTLAGA
ncbi:MULTISPECIES: type II secretion system inner membrane protein GspF [Sphingomonadales]|uniref:General secretion pathway protein F n=1 Tax=Edaphosphingomonas haloaromaticamans TaxID=653954 RepID=A0A1S1HF75_9SPHN|nr:MULTISPECIES: type II secretion system inner membrane protein GspF [Sphingomonas]AGH47792.1 general secretion pathway protein F [Sphingomonas sp. MM-1]MDX3882959.1 type II secretion system inner membrane protein GspF [Sphingomonas sp.]OHT20156.1 Type II secretion system protein F [Sphingomonas haloaromaticamans]